LKLGIGSYTYMWSIGFPGASPAKPMSAMDLLARAHEFGVRAVQYGPNLALYELSCGELNETLAAARQWGIEIEVGTRGVEPAHLRRMIDFTSGCGSALLRTVPEMEDGRVPTRSELIATLESVEPHFRQARVRLAMENTLMPAAELAGALRAVNSPFLGVTLDTVNSLAIPEGTREVARHLVPWTCCLHVKDFQVSREWHMMGFRVEGRPAGRGQLDVPALLAELRGAGASANAILELWAPAQPELEQTIALEESWAVESVNYLRNLIGE
jgi:sugar phosphate isomerase/epimerase